MEKPLFRKESMERISSPEQLHDYLRVTTPRLWMLLTAIIVILAGFVVYASTATMESTETIQVDVENYTIEDETLLTVSCSLPLSMKDVIAVGMTVRVAGEEGKVSLLFQDADNIGAMIQMNNPALRLPDGTYDAELVTESTTPISFLLN